MKLMNDFFENKLNECNIKRYLPRNSSLANYLPFVFSNNFVFISGKDRQGDSLRRRQKRNAPHWVRDEAFW